MKKLLISIIKIPIFIIRSINAALMRLPFSFVFIVAAYAFMYRMDFFDRVWIGPDGIIVHIGVACVLSLIWGIIYTITKPPIIKKIYDSASSKMRGGVFRLILGVGIVFYAYVAKDLPVLVEYFLFFYGAELILNALLIFVKARTKAQIGQALAKYQNLQKGSSNSSAQKGASEILKDDFKKSALTAEVQEKFNDVMQRIKLKNATDNYLKQLIKTIEDYTYIEKTIMGKNIKAGFLSYRYKHGYVDCTALAVGMGGVFVIDTFFDKKYTLYKNTPDGKVYAQSSDGKINKLENLKNRCFNAKNAIIELVGTDTPVYCIVLCIDEKNSTIEIDTNADLKIVMQEEFMQILSEHKSENILKGERMLEVIDILNSSKLTEKEVEGLECI